MRRSAVTIVLLSLVFFMVFCDAVAGEAPEDTLFTYDFSGLVFEVRFIEGAAILYLPDGPLTLPQGISASGARYTDGSTTFWNKGDDAHLEINGSVVGEKTDLPQQ